jgi:hypothetical protein
VLQNVVVRAAAAAHPLLFGHRPSNGGISFQQVRADEAYSRAPLDHDKLEKVMASQKGRKKKR